MTIWCDGCRRMVPRAHTNYNTGEPCYCGLPDKRGEAYRAMRDALTLVQAHGSLAREARMTVDNALRLAQETEEV